MSVSRHPSPHAQARALQWRNGFARHALLCWGLAPVMAALLAALAWAAIRPAWIGLLRACATHPLLLAALALLLTAAGTTRHKRRVQVRLARSWLAALPVRTPLLQEVARLPLAVGTLVLLAVGVARVAGLSAADAGGILVPVAAGAGVGFVTGWHWRRAERVTVPGSWYASVRRVRGGTLRPSLLALGYWALARTRVWGRPQITARQVLIVLLGVPMGAPAAQALAAVAATLIAWHLAALLAAVVRVAFAAAWWLAPTPLRLSRFTAALVHRAWARQIVVCALALVAVAALGRSAALDRGATLDRAATLDRGATLDRAATLVAVWLALCIISGSAACTIAWRRRSHGG